MGDHVGDEELARQEEEEEERHLRSQMSHEGTPNPMPIIPLMVSYLYTRSSQMSQEGLPTPCPLSHSWWATRIPVAHKCPKRGSQSPNPMPIVQMLSYQMYTSRSQMSHEGDTQPHAFRPTHGKLPI